MSQGWGGAGRESISCPEGHFHLEDVAFCFKWDVLCQRRLMIEKSGFGEQGWVDAGFPHPGAVKLTGFQTAGAPGKRKWGQ